MTRAVPVTPREAMTLVARQVAEWEAAGLPREAAVVAAALTLRVEPHRVVVLARPVADSERCSN